LIANDLFLLIERKMKKQVLREFLRSHENEPASAASRFSTALPPAPALRFAHPQQRNRRSPSASITEIGGVALLPSPYTNPRKL
jgi:hypothetical protein